MIHLGIDHHKKFSEVAVLDDKGELIRQGKLPCQRESWAMFKESLPKGEPVQSVLEAGWNWGKLYDMIEELEYHPKLANPLKVRLIAESRIKTDKRDAQTLAHLLRMGWLPEVHVPSREIRDRKNLLRERMWLIRKRAEVKNRIYSILDRNHQAAPEVSDLFGARGISWIKALTLRTPDNWLLEQNLGQLSFLEKQIKAAQKWIDEIAMDHPDIGILESIPGIGKLLATMIALEIDGVARFATPEKLCAYSGLVSSTYMSGNKTWHGPLISGANRHLRYAFVEAAWTAKRSSPYFVSFYKRLKARRGAQKAIVATGRKLCVIAFLCLQNRRNYHERAYRFQPSRLGCVLA